MKGWVGRLAGLLTALILCFSFGAKPALCAEEPEGGIGTMDIKSTAFKNGETIPKKYTCEGEDVSPPLSWSSPPNGTKSMVLICDDPDAPVGTWVHWVLFGLSPSVTSLPEGVPAKESAEGAKQGRNDFGNLGYGGPCPPPGPAHRYFFKLYAVDKELNLKPGATKAEVMKAIEGHILDEGQLMGKYRR